MLDFKSIMIGSENPEKLRDFYKEVFKKSPDMSDGGYYGFLVGTGFITIAPHDKVKGKSPNPERILLNFEIEDVNGEFERIEKIDGAKVVAKPYEMGDEKMKATIATFADPDGNFFQLMTPWKG